MADPGDSVPDAVLRPGLTWAFAAIVAAARPPASVPVPGPLRPFARFRTLPPAALAVVRRVLDDDTDLRERLAESLRPGELDRASTLFLTRPDGWDDELAKLAADREQRLAAVRDEHDERTARRRLDAAERSRTRAEADAEHARRLAHDHALAVRSLEARVGELERALAAAGDEHRRLQRLARSAEQRAAQAEQRAAQAEQRAAQAEQRAAQQRRPESESVSPAPQPLSDSPLDTAEFDRLVTAVDDAAAALAGALDRARRALGTVGPAVPAVRGTGRLASRSSAPSAPVRRRSPLPVVRGLPADSVELALGWLRTPGVILVVDGYNVAKLGWPDLPLAVQRERLLDLLEGLDARLGTQIEVVFDGADLRDVVPTGRRHVRVSFSPAGVTADDVIVALVEALDPEVPVVVATDDGAVRTAAGRGLGANLVSSRQLLAAARA